MLSRLRPLVRSAPVAIGLVALAFFALLSAWDGWRRLELKGYDLLMVLSAPGRSALPITIIGIDDPSFAEIGKQWPWPRRLHAELIEQLNRAGAMVVAFDVTLSETSNEEDDRLFAEAIRKAGNVVLAAALVYQETPYIRQWIRVDPIDAFKIAGAGNGFANIPRDSDLVLRRMPEGVDVFWREIVRRANLLRPGLLEEPASVEGRMIGYIGPDHTVPYFSYYQALHADTHLPPDVFRDQIVLVGRDVRSAIETGGNDDNFATPFTPWTGWLTPGAEIHANIMESALSGSSVMPLSWVWVFALLLVSITLSALLMRRWRPFINAGLGMVLLMAIALADYWLFAQYRLWLPVLAAMLSVMTVYLGLGGHAFFSEQRQRRETRRAFSMYLAPEVVDQIMANPEKLVLGGERRDITLLFTDLAGFTNISEQLGPEQVTQLLNEHFSRATAIIKRHGGTVNRFIGDAIMAFWGAPLADERQALNACLAARDMQADMHKLREELAQRGLPPLNMRIGIHSGAAIVGNLGSSDRFDYTAIGDSVNLAARLEGVNKLYATEILLSADTANQVGDKLAFRRVDRVIVKGKTEPIDIYTISDNLQINALSSQAFDAYCLKDWAGSEQLWRSVIEIKQDDSIASHYLGRIEELRNTLIPEEWTGATALEKL